MGLVFLEAVVAELDGGVLHGYDEGFVVLLVEHGEGVAYACEGFVDVLVLHLVAHGATHIYGIHLPTGFGEFFDDYILEVLLTRYGIAALLGGGIVEVGDGAVLRLVRLVVAAPVLTELAQLAVVLHEHGREGVQCLASAILALVELACDDPVDVGIVVEGDVQGVLVEAVAVQAAGLDLLQFGKVGGHVVGVDALTAYHRAGYLEVHGILHRWTLERHIAVDVLDIEVGVEAVAGCLLLEVEDAHGIDHGRKVALHAGNVVGSEEVDVVERVGAIEGEGVATEVVDAILIGLALANGLHLEVFFGCDEVFVVEEQFAIVGTDDVVVDEPIHRLLVHTRHGEDAEGSLPCLASLCNEAYLVALLGGDDHHLAPCFLGSAEEFVEVDYLFGIAFELGL